jgi:hypothetical protein
VLAALLAGSMASACARSPFDRLVGGDGAASTEAPDAGEAPDSACATRADCSGPLPPMLTPLCQKTAWSCIAGACVADCGDGQSCWLGDGRGCIQCTPTAGSCPASGSACSWPATMMTWIELGAARCPAVFPAGSDPFVGAALSVERTDPASCTFAVGRPDGGASFGTFEVLGRGDLFGDFPGLGGACVGVWAATDAPRVIWSCPLCQFSMGVL